MPVFPNRRRPSAEELAEELNAANKIMTLLEQQLKSADTGAARGAFLDNIEKLKPIVADCERQFAVRLRERARAQANKSQEE